LTHAPFGEHLAVFRRRGRGVATEVSHENAIDATKAHEAAFGVALEPRGVPPTGAARRV